MVRLFGNTEAKKVTAFVGPEQEYFLVDREKYLKRRDLIYTGRTLFALPPPRARNWTTTTSAKSGNGWAPL